MRFTILSLFPEYFDSPFNASILKKARDSGLLNIEMVDIRDFAEGKHKKVDDRPYGGGPGMVMMAKPLRKAILHIQAQRDKPLWVVYLSPQGT